jgi:hypothetical protein
MPKMQGNNSTKKIKMHIRYYMAWVGAWGRYGGQERCIQGLVGRPELKKPLGRHSHRWEDIIKIDI